MNLKLIKKLQFFNQYPQLKIKYKPNKHHIFYDALSKLRNFNINNSKNEKYSELNVLYICNTTNLKLNEKFKIKIIKNTKKPVGKNN